MKRFVWNFEFNIEQAFAWSDLTAVKPDELRWEARFFWPAEDIIAINGLSEEFLEV
jgi:hypothetical protein